MYDELIKNLRHDSVSALQNCEFDFVHDWMLKAADAIEELRKQLREEKVDNVNLTGWLAEEHAKHLWIPVTERLPESVCKSYLCLTDTGYHCEVRWTNNAYGLWKSGNKWGWSIADVPQYCKVTHWMPLPQPPESDGEP